MMDKEQITAFRQLLDRFGSCPYTDEELPDVHALLFSGTEDFVFTGIGIEEIRICEALNFLRFIVKRHPFTTLSELIDHLSTCSDCSRSFDFYKNLSEAELLMRSAGRSADGTINYN